MRSTSYPTPVTRAVGWRRVLNALALFVCTVLLVFAAANTAPVAMTDGHAAPIAISITASLAHATDVNVAARRVACGEHTARSIPLHPSLHRANGACPFEPDLWLDDRDDDDDDDEVGRHGTASRRSAVSVEEALDLRPSRTLGGSAVPDGSLPVNLLLSDTARRM